MSVNTAHQCNNRWSKWEDTSRHVSARIPEMPMCVWVCRFVVFLFCSFVHVSFSCVARSACCFVRVPHTQTVDTMGADRMMRWAAWWPHQCHCTSKIDLCWINQSLTRRRWRTRTRTRTRSTQSRTHTKMHTKTRTHTHVEQLPSRLSRTRRVSSAFAFVRSFSAAWRSWSLSSHLIIDVYAIPEKCGRVPGRFVSHCMLVDCVLLCLCDGRVYD